MLSLHGKLASLNQRLQSIIQLTTDQDHSIKVDDAEVDPTKTNYICAECAWMTSTSVHALARHFTSKHAFRIKCPHCKSLHEDPEQLKKHRSQKHRHRCPTCRRFFATVKECKHHEPCESQYRIAQQTSNNLSPHEPVDHDIDGDASPHEPVDQDIGGNASPTEQSSLMRRWSGPSGCCPDPGCQLTFLNFDSLYEHYVGLHPLSTVHHGHPKPFKCPFCPKRYRHDRFIPGHVRKHKRRSSNVPGVGDAEDQQALIQQSHVAMANRKPQLRAEPQAQADRTSSGEEVDDSIRVMEEEDYNLVFKDGVIYIDEAVEPESSTSEQSDQTNLQESQCLKATPFGLVLQACPTDSEKPCPKNDGPSVEVDHQTFVLEPESYDPMDLDNDYPERFALDEEDLPSRTRHLDTSIIAVRFLNEILYQSLLRRIVSALQMHYFVSVNEVADLFIYFLDEAQRMYVLNEIGSINFNQHDSSILLALQDTVFRTLLGAWVDFKRFALRYAPQSIIQANNQGNDLEKSVTWALLQYCLDLENLIYCDETNIADHFLREPLRKDLAVANDVPFPRLVAALAERVKNRIHPSIVLTNEMILRGTRDYVELLQTIFRAFYPIDAGHERLWRELRLL